MFELFEKSALKSSKLITNIYSTSFSLGIRMISPSYRWAVYGIYGLVRYADEIVDTFEHQDKAVLLEEFRNDTYKAIERGISLNPVLQSFQAVANHYHIGKDLIEPFFNSMEADLHKNNHNNQTYSDYIYGSAEVVGLMCLKVFCDGDEQQYNQLKEPARALGAAFQKVNFLRDIKSDVEDRKRIYFPDLDISHFNEQVKRDIIADVRKDFQAAYEGILNLPLSCRFGVYTSYRYYLRLLDKIESSEVSEVLNNRIRVANTEKMAVLARSFFRYKLNAL